MRAGLFIVAAGALCLLPGCGLNQHGSGAADGTVTAKSLPHNDIDLAVSNLSVARDAARPGAWVLTFTVSNLGNDVTPYTVIPHAGMSYRPIPWTVTADGDTWGSGAVSGLTGNDFTTCTVELDALPAGAITLDVTVDPDNAIPDLKRGNNRGSVLVTVGGAG